MDRTNSQKPLIAALALCAVSISGFSQPAGSPYQDPHGRFSLRVPNGWTLSPLGDAVQLKFGNALASVMVSEGSQKPDQLMLSLGGQMAGQWRNFKELQHASTTLGGQPASYGVFAGLNPQGVDSLLKIVAASNSRYAFALIMSSPTGEFMSARPGFDALELGFAIPGATAPPSSNTPGRTASNAPAPGNGQLPDRPVPAGFTMTPDPQGTGRVLAGSFSGNARSATEAARGILSSLRGYFDNAPEIHTAARTDTDRQVQAFFSATIQNVPVVGVIGVELNGSGGTVAVIFDRAGSLRNSYARLRGKSAAVEQPRLNPVNLPDGSHIEIPAGWRIAASGKGTVDVAGPNGESVSLGAAAPVYTQAPRSPIPGVAIPDNYVLSGPCCDPVRALTALTPQFSAMAQKMGLPSLQLTRVLDAQPTQSPVNGGQAAFVFAEIQVGGRPSQSLAWIMAAPTGYGQWVYYISNVTAPKEVFAGEAQTLLAIWKSYSTNPAVFAERLDNAVKSMNAATQSVLEAGREASRVRSAVNERWDQVIRGVDTVENSTTGRRYQVDNVHARDLVDGLNQTGNGNWRVVPLDDLAPRR